MTHYAREQDAREAYAGANASDARLRAIMSAAAGMVARIAPPPSGADVTLDYEQRAADAELLAGAWLWSTGGYVERSSVFESSQQYTSTTLPPGVEQAIRDAMGQYGSGGLPPPATAGASQITINSSFAESNGDALPVFNRDWPDNTGWPIQ